MIDQIRALGPNRDLGQSGVIYADVWEIILHYERSTRLVER